MYVGFDLDAFDPDDSRTLTADFTKMMSDDEAIIEATWECSVADDSETDDEDAADHVSIPATYDGQKTFQHVSGLVDGVKYVLQAVVGTDQGNTYSLWSHITCRAPH